MNGCNNERIIIIGCQYEYTYAKPLLSNPTGNFNTRCAWHPNIENHDIRIVSLNQLFSLLTIRRFGDYLNIAIFFKEVSNPFTNNGMIVC